MQHHHIASAAFSKKTLKALAQKNLFVVSSSWAPGEDGTFTNGVSVYLLSNGQVKTFLDVLALA